MNEARRNFLVGLFVALGLAAFGSLIVLFGKVPTWIMRVNTYPLTIHFDSAAGIREGTLVTLAGKSIGRVRTVDFVDTVHIDRGVRVLASIEQQYRLPRGCRAVTSESFLGMGRPPIQILIDAPSEEFLGPDEVILGRTSSAVETIFPSSVVDTLQKTATQIGEAAEALQPVLVDFHDMMQPQDMAEVDRAGRAGNLRTAIARLDAGLKHVNDVLGDPAVKSQLREAVANFHAVSSDGKAAAAQFRQFADDARQIGADVKTLAQKANTSIDNMDQRVDQVGRALLDNLDRTARVLDGMALVASQIRKGEGSIGKFVADDRLYESMVLTFKRLAEATEEFRVLVKDWQKGKIRVGL